MFKNLTCLPVHPQSNRLSTMDFLILDFDIADGPKKTCQPLKMRAMSVLICTKDKHVRYNLYTRTRHKCT